MKQGGSGTDAGRKETIVTQQERGSTEELASDDGRMPVMQEIYDNIWFLFLVSGIIILVFYIIWGLIDLLNTPTLP